MYGGLFHSNRHEIDTRRMARQSLSPFEQLRSRPRTGARNLNGMLRYITAALALLLTFNSITHFAPTSAPLRWFSLLLPSTTNDGLHPAYLRHLASSLQTTEHGGLSPKLGLNIGRYAKVDPVYPADYQWIDSDTRTPFHKDYYRWANTNNAISRLPPGSGFDALVIARGMSNEYRSAEDPQSDKTSLLRNSTLIGFYANFDEKASTWVRAGPAPYVLDLPVWRQTPRPCLDRVEAGPEDPRLMWTDEGQLLLVFGTTSQVSKVCRSMAVVDLRVVWPEFADLMTRLGHGDVPLRIDAVTELGKEGPKEPYEKNWAPFFAGASVPSRRARIYRPWFDSSSEGFTQSNFPQFHANVVPSIVLQTTSDPDLLATSMVEKVALTGSTTKTDYMTLVESESSSPSIANDLLSEAANTCFQASFPNFQIHSIHQATPYYRVTLCPRGTCKPDSTNTVLFALGHLKISWNEYRRFFMTLSVDAPHAPISVSQPVHLGSHEFDSGVVFAVSAAFFPSSHVFGGSEGSSDNTTESDPFFKQESWDPSPESHLGHGWLDDTLIIGAGWKDTEMASFHMPLASALKQHRLC